MLNNAIIEIISRAENEVLKETGWKVKLQALIITDPMHLTTPEVNEPDVVNAIIDACCIVNNCGREGVFKHTKKGDVVDARSMICALIQEKLGYSNVHIAAVLNREHTFVGFHINRFKERIKHNPPFARRFAKTNEYLKKLLIKTDEPTRETNG